MADTIITVGGDLTQLERQIQDVLSRNFRLSGLDTKGFVQPLGKIKGQLGEFEKSLEASNARVVAFGASAGAIYLLGDAFKGLVRSTIEVEKSLADINTVLNESESNLKKFGNEVFNVANATSQSFETASQAALEFSRQGLGLEETLKRTSAALTLAKISGLSAADSVEALTATINSFNDAALTDIQIVNKLAAVDARYAVSSADLAEAIKRVGSSASEAGVSLDQLIALVTSAQQTTARGGAVIGNSFKTIFTRLQRPKVLESLNELGIQTQNVAGQTLPLIQILSQLAKTYDNLSSAQKSQVAELVGGVYQINILKAVVGDLSKEFGSTYTGALRASISATNEAEKRVDSLAKTLDSQINRVFNNLKRAGSVVGDLTIAPALERVLGAANAVLETFALGKEPESLGEKAAVGFLKGLGNFIAGPGLLIAAVGAFQIFKRLASFVSDAGRTILGLGEAAQKQAQIQAQILQLLQRNPALYSQIQSGAISVQDAAQGYLNIVNLTNQALEKQRALAAQIAQAAVSGAAGGGSVGGGGGGGGGRRGSRRRASSGFIPNFADEGQMLESVGAANHKNGYKAGQAYQTTIHDGKGKSFRSWVNSAEYVKTFTNAAGYKATIVRPPNGFGPGTQIAAEGFVPNFAPKKAKDKDKGLRIFRSDAKVSSISGSKLNASFDRKQSSYRINISPTSTAFFESSDKRKQMDTGRKSLDAGYTVENGQIVPNSAFDKFMGAINIYKVADAEEIRTAANVTWEGLIKKDPSWTTNPVFSKFGLSPKNARRAFFNSLRKNNISYSDIKEKFNRQSGNATNDVVFKFGSGKTMTSPKDYQKSLNGDFNNFKGAFYEAFIANKLGSKYLLSKGDYDPVDIMAKEGAGTKFKGFEIKSGSVANVSTLVNKAINSVNFNSANDAPAVVDFGTFPVIQTRGSSIGGVSNFSSGFIPNFAPGDGSYTLAEYANKKGVRISQLKKSAFNAAYEKGVSLAEIKQYDPKFEYKGATIQEAARRAEAAQAQKQKLKEDFGFNKKLIKEIVIPWNKTAADFGGNNAAFGDAYESHVFQFLRQRYGDRFKTATELGLVGTRTKDGQIVDRNFADVEGALLDKKGRIMMWFDAKAQSQKGQLAYSRTGKGGVAEKFFRAEAKNPNLKLNPRRVAAVFRNMSKGFVPHFAPVRGGTFYDFDETLVHYPKDINPKELFFPESVRKASLTPLGRSLQKSSSPINVLTARGKNSKSAIEQFLTKSNIPFNKVIASAEMFRNVKVPGVRKNERGLTSAEKKARFLQNLYGKTRMPSRLIDDAPANIQAIQGLNNPNITGELYSTEGQMGLGRSFKSSGFIPNFAKSKNFAEYRNNAIQKIETKNEYGYIESSYPKNIKIGNKKLEGSVLASPLGPNLYSIGASGVNIVGGGFGVPLYDSVLAEVSKKEAWLTSDRAIVSEKAKKIWDGYRKLRTGDVKNKKLPMKYWIADIAFTGGDNNLSGNPVNAMLKNKSNWPPENDPVWALQYAYQFKKFKLDNFVKKKMSSGFIPNFAELDSGARSMLIGSGIIPFVVDLQRKTMAASSAGDDMFHSQIVNKKFIDPKTGKSIYTKLYGDDIHSATWKDTFVRGFVNSSTGAVTFDLTAPQKEDKKFLSKHSVLLEKVKQKYAEKFKSAIQIKPKRISPLAAFRSSGYIPNFNSALNDAVNREMDAGYSKSQIRIGKSPSLATGLNPEGYGVYNSTEGNLSRGIKFAKDAGINPKTKGMSRGFIPNFAYANSRVGKFTEEEFFSKNIGSTYSDEARRAADIGNRERANPFDAEMARRRKVQEETLRKLQEKANPATRFTPTPEYIKLKERLASIRKLKARPGTAGEGAAAGAAEGRILARLKEMEGSSSSPEEAALAQKKLESKRKAFAAENAEFERQRKIREAEIKARSDETRAKMAERMGGDKTDPAKNYERFQKSVRRQQEKKAKREQAASKGAYSSAGTTPPVAGGAGGGGGTMPPGGGTTAGGGGAVPPRGGPPGGSPPGGGSRRGPRSSRGAKPSGGFLGKLGRGGAAGGFIRMLVAQTIFNNLPDIASALGVKVYEDEDKGTLTKTGRAIESFASAAGTAAFYLDPSFLGMGKDIAKKARGGLGKVAGSISPSLNRNIKAPSILGKLTNTLETAGSKLGKPGSKLSKFGGAFGKRIPVLGTALAAAGGLFEGARRSSQGASFTESLLLGGLPAIGSILGTAGGALLGSFGGPVGTFAGGAAGGYAGGKIGTGIAGAIIGKQRLAQLDQAGKDQAYFQNEISKYKTASGKDLATYNYMSQAQAGEFGTNTKDVLNKGSLNPFSKNFGGAVYAQKFDYGEARKGAAGTIAESVGGIKNAETIFDKTGQGKGKAAVDKFAEEIYKELERQGKETGGLKFNKAEYEALRNRNNAAEQGAKGVKALTDEEKRLLETYKTARDVAGQLIKNIERMKDLERVGKVFETTRKGIEGLAKAIAEKASKEAAAYKVVQEKEKERGDLLKKNYGGGVEGYMNPEENLKSINKMAKSLRVLNDPRLRNNQIERGRAAIGLSEGATEMGINIPQQFQTQLNRQIETGFAAYQGQNLRYIGNVAGGYKNSFGIQQGINESAIAMRAFATQQGEGSIQSAMLTENKGVGLSGYRSAREEGLMKISPEEMKRREEQTQKTLDKLQETIDRLAGLQESVAKGLITREQYEAISRSITEATKNFSGKRLEDELQKIFETLPQKIREGLDKAGNGGGQTNNTVITSKVELDLSDDAKAFVKQRNTSTSPAETASTNTFNSPMPPSAASSIPSSTVGYYPLPKNTNA